MKKLTKYDFDVHKNFTKKNNPSNWENGCDICKSSFSENEVFVRVDERGWDGVWSFHKGDCFGKGMYRLLQGDTLGFDYGVTNQALQDNK